MSQVKLARTRTYDTYSGLACVGSRLKSLRQILGVRAFVVEALSSLVDELMICAKAGIVGRAATVMISIC